MEWEAYFVAAEVADVPDIVVQAQPLDLWSGFAWPCLDTFKLATIDALLTGDPIFEAMDRYEPLVILEGVESTQMVFAVDERAVSCLLSLSEESVFPYAEELVASEAFDANEVGSIVYSADVLAEALLRLVELSLLAESQSQQLFVKIDIPHPEAHEQDE